MATDGDGPNDGIHLAVSPVCGSLSGNFADVNGGLKLKDYKTIVSFGDSYTDGGHQDGSPLDPPIIIPPNPLAGGRSTNGKVWNENIADDIGAKLMDYAAAGACTDLSLWPSNPRPLDFLGQMKIFLGQNNVLDPDTTLYTIFFGINDYEASKIDGDANMHNAALVILNQMQILASPPTNARSFLITDVYGRGAHSAAGEAYKQTIFSGINQFHMGVNVSAPLKVAFADFSRIWDGVLGTSPGFKAFGYTSTASCIVCTDSGCTTDGMCSDPAHYFEWFPGHPSKETDRIMADYVEEVLTRCDVG